MNCLLQNFRELVKEAFILKFFKCTFINVIHKKISWNSSNYKLLKYFDDAEFNYIFTFF